jgi:ankyrin repeat protein
MEKKNKALVKACIIGDLAAVEKAINEGANVNYKDETGHTPLLISSNSGNIELVKMLISKGADINSKELFGTTALHIASGLGYIEVVEFLIKNGANVNVKNRTGSSPLSSAVSKNNIEIVKLLLANGATIDKLTMDSAKSKEVKDILDKWPHSMAILALQENQVYNQHDMSYLEDLDQYTGKKGEHYGGKRKNKKSKKRKSRKSKKSIKKENKGKGLRMQAPDWLNLRFP